MSRMKQVAGWVLGCVVAGAGDSAGAADATPPPVSVQVFFGVTAMSKPVLSPDGRRLAVLMGSSTGRHKLAVVSLDPPRAARVVAGATDLDVYGARWVNDKRLVFSLVNLFGSWDEQRWPGLFAVDADGENLRQLVHRQWSRLQEARTVPSRVLMPTHRLLRVLRDGSDDVIVERHNFDSSWRDVLDTTALRLNTRTWQAQAISSGYPTGARQWLVDESGQARMLLTRREGRAQIHWRKTIESPWETLTSFDAYRGGAGSGFQPLTVGPDGEIYALAQRNDAAGTEALFRFDRTRRALEPEALVGLSGFDFEGRLIFNHKQRKLLGVRYVSDAVNTAWFDDGMKRLQARVDQLLPGVVNLLDVPECACSRWVLVTSYSDRQPALYLLYDREGDRVELIGRNAPDVDPRRMAERDFVRFTARDGLSIPAHVTRPDPRVHGKGPWPTVMLVHGGPQVRGGSWEWDADSQFLASRGYLVVEPEFRGSRGYGQKHFQAGWKQWGLAMQDDVADAARWAITQKLADPKRICIAGASYGGYATLMGLIRDPDLYRCGVAWAAVTDIQMMFDLHWSDLSEEWKGHGLPVLVGDPQQDAERFAATSPLRQAARLKQPLLLAFGGEDRRVPIEHGTRFRDAVTKTNTQVEWIEYRDEGHGWYKPENRFDWWTRVERFLGQHIGPK